MQEPIQMLHELARSSSSRENFWQRFVNEQNVRQMLEIGVYRGDFAESLLKSCKGIETYYMLDPWRHLDQWNKPANVSKQQFDGFYEEVMSRTEFAADRRFVLRGTSTEVIDRIPDGSLELAYIDGDHTLRGITIDLIRVYPKLRVGGWIGGDDFCHSIWQHPSTYEPTLVFPFAVHFAEAVGASLFALPFSQFLMRKNPHPSFVYHDLTNSYGPANLKDQIDIRKLISLRIREAGKWLCRQPQAISTRWLKSRRS